MYLTKLASIQLINWKIIEEYNQDPEEIFAKAELDPSLMYQAGARYPLANIAKLWQEMERVIKDPCFGLTAATGWHPANFGTLGYALLMSTCLRTTLERLIRFHRVISDARFAKLYDDKSSNSLIFELTGNDVTLFSAAREDAALAWIVSVLQVNYQRPLSPLAVSFTHSRPAGCAGRYYEVFKAPVEFDSSSAKLVLSIDEADRILPRGDEELLQWKEQVMTKYLAERGNLSLTQKVKKIIVEHLPTGDATIENVAIELHMSVRSLQRFLTKDNTSFLQILNETRQEIAKQYLEKKEMELTEIAFLLGFSDQSTFSRSFKRWTGKTPKKYQLAA